MTLTAPAPDLLPPEPFDMPTVCPTLDPPMPPGFGAFIDPDRFAELQAMQTDLQARAKALVPLVLTILEGDTAMCAALQPIADRARVLYDGDPDPQARAFETLLDAVGSSATTRILACISHTINCLGPLTLAELCALEEELS